MATLARAAVSLLLALAAVGALLAALVAAAIAASPAKASAAKPYRGTHIEVLSDMRLTTRWAYVERAAKIRSGPDSSAKAIGRLHVATELGAPEVYVALKRALDSELNPWYKVDVPGRPNGKVGWVPAGSLGALTTVHKQLVINREKLKATLYRHGKDVWAARVGVGAHGTSTPKGRFYIREALKLKGKGGSYGAFAFGTSAYSPHLTDWPGGGVIGIHGTNEPNLIPGHISHGCIRLRNAAIKKLEKQMPIGTAVLIK